MDLIWLSLFLLGLAVMAAEIVVFSFGALLVTGFILTGYALYVLDQAGQMFGHPVTEGTLIVLLLAGLLVLAVALTFALKHYNRRAKPLLEGERVTVEAWEGGRGCVRVQGGEIWRAVSKQDFTAGDAAIVTAIDHLLLTIAKE